MGQFPTRYEQEEKLHQLLSTYEMSDLRNVYEYLTNDFLYIVQSLETEFLLREMASCNVLKVEKYEELRKDLDSFAFSEKMVQDILGQGREAIIAFWESLYQIYCLSACANLSCLVYELGNTGDTLMQQIQQDKHGHSLSSELKDIQEHYRHHLLGYVQNIDNRRTSTSKRETPHGDHYMDMIVLSVYHFRRRSQHELVESGVKHEGFLHKSVQHCVNTFISMDRLFRWSQHFQCVPHSVMITGATGVGKTTLIKKFLYDWAYGNIYQRFSFVFFFRFQELNRLDKVSLETMILQFHPHLQSHLVNILQQPEKVLFIFEGLDESIHQMNFRSHQLCSDISQVEDVGLIVVNLVRQSLLKGCFVILTSKTARVTRRDAPAFMRIAEMTGLSPKDKEILFQNYFKEKTLSDQVLSYVRNNGAIANFCYNPTFCRIVCEVMSVHCKEQPMDDQNLPKTLTQLMAGFVGKILSGQKQNKMNFRKLLASLGWMADHGLSNNIRDFEEYVLDTFKVDATSDLLQYFMLKSGHPPNVTFSFLHLFLQDFLAALVHYIQYSAEKLNKLLEKANSSKDCHDEIFLCFLCGLMDQATRDTLKPYLGDLSSRAIVRAVKSIATWLVQQSSKEAQKLAELQYDKRKCLTMFYYLFETRNKNLVKEALGSCKRLTLKSVLLTRLDCAALSFVLESCKEIEELDLDDCTLHTDCLGQFTAHLHYLKDIRLLGVKMGNDGIQSVCPALLHPESRVQSLWLGWNKLTDVSCLYLSLAIKNNRSLKILDLSNNNLYGPHFSDLMDALSAPACSIQELLLDSSGLTDISCIQLASGIRNNRSLRKLHLSRNLLIGPHFGALVDALSGPTCGIEELELCSIELGDEDAPLLGPLSNNPHLTHLDLSSNLLTDAGARHIGELILKSSSLKEISLCFNRKITSETQQKLRDLKVHKPDLFVFIDG